MPEVKGIISYTIPMFGNRRALPYGDLLISDGTTSKVCRIRDSIDGGQYVTFKRRRYPVVNIGSLYSPAYKLKC